ncbi:MAG: hypothetical protein WDW38_002124 [Sanguina aurantia]
MGKNHVSKLALALRRELQVFGSSVRSISTETKGGVLTSNQAEKAQKLVSEVQTRGAAQVATMTKTQQALPTMTRVIVPSIETNVFGAVSMVSENTVLQEGVYQNADGLRHEDGRYAAFIEEITSFIPEQRQYTDALRTFAYGTDASFYRLNPKLVVKVHSEEDIRKVLPIAVKHQVPVTFRAAGTSLSGQAITDSVLLKLSHTGKNFRNFTVHGDGSSITVEPGLIGGEVNKILAAHQKRGNHPIQYKIGPDPSSIDSCMIGGIVANNSSGMCCGVSQNTYHTLKDMRVVFVDGSVLDTADPVSCKTWMDSHTQLVDGVLSLARRIQADKELSGLIRRKFAIKCTTGYSLNALVDFPTDSPIEIIKHLLIGSEGTLGFVSRATYNTVPEWSNKASAFIMFPDVRAACQASSILRNETAVDAVELFDRASLRECEANEDMTRLVPGMRGADAMAAGLLIECRGQDAAALTAKIFWEVTRSLARSGLPFGPNATTAMTVGDFPFQHNPAESKIFWDVRKGLIPIVGGAREAGTSMLIEDVACPVDKLADLMIDLIDMFQRHGYHDASCFGHALEGNLHLVFSQGFRNKEEVQRFGDMMEEMCYLVATKHSGSLKGEHGTGRNVAPFVEMEWGAKAYDLMWELKELFDPEYVLNPGVILNKDPDAHMKFLKPSPAASEIVNRCIECGFCESNCPSKDLSMTPRQRITVYREMHRLKTLPSASVAESSSVSEDQPDTCEWKSASTGAAWVGNNFSGIAKAVPTLLNTVSLIHKITGPKPLLYISRWLNRVSDHYIPVWNPYMPRGAAKLQIPIACTASVPSVGVPRKVVYMPSCVTRMMGPALGDDQTASVHETLMSLFAKAGYEVIIPQNTGALCCGMLFNSRGFADAAAAKGSEMEDALMVASENGKIPIVCDTSPCLSQIKSQISEPALRFALYEPVEFIRHFLADKLEFKKVRDSVAVHVPCSSKKMGIEDSFMKLAGLCSHEVVGSGIACCGMAGDRGMRYPELTGASLQHLNLPKSCTDGYSTSRTCEMSLSNHSGINFRGLVYLIDEATTAKKAPAPHASA